MNFNEETLQAVLSGKTIGQPLYYYASLESTNHRAFKLAGEGAPEGTIVIADHQTAGRGRLQRVWQSPPALNLYVSLIIRPDLAAVSSAPLTIMAGVAVAELLNSFCPRQVQLKWPNDVLINNKKISGILTEMKTAGHKVEFVVIGIGININMQLNDFNSPLQKLATSLRNELGRAMDRVEITAKLLDNIGMFYSLFLREGIKPIRDLWLHYTQLLEKEVEITFGKEAYRGTVMGMDEAGALLLRDENGEPIRIFAGDVKVIGG